MRRGQYAPSPDTPAHGWTKQELLAAVDVNDGRRPGLSPKTFDLLPKAARVKGPGHGGLSRVFPAEDVAAMIRCDEDGRFTERGGPIAAAWRGLLSGRGVAMEQRTKQDR